MLQNEEIEWMGQKKVGLYIDSRFYINKKSKYLSNQKVTKKSK